MCGLAGRPWTLAIDRTNWKLGRTEINILMISAEWRGISVPLIFTVLSKAGNSNTGERIDLLSRLKRVFPKMKIAALTGGREFIGNAWMAHLEKEKIPFILRLKENQHVARDGFATWPAERIAQNLKRGGRMTVKGFAVSVRAARAQRFVSGSLSCGLNRRVAGARHERPARARARPLSCALEN